MFVDDLLGDSLGEIANKDVCLWVRFVIHLLNAHGNDLILDLGVVQLLLGFLSVFLSLELSVAVVQRLVGLLVDDNDCLHDGKTLLFNHLIQVEVVVLSGQVANVEGGESLLLLALLLLLSTAASAGVGGGTGLGRAHKCLHTVDKHHLIGSDHAGLDLTLYLLGEAILLHGALVVVTLGLGTATGVLHLGGDLLDLRVVHHFSTG
jgi:hypothetical protein